MNPSFSLSLSPLSVSTINTSYVLRVLDSALNHALVLKPKRVEWLVLRADLRGGEVALRDLEGGSLVLQYALCSCRQLRCCIDELS